MKRTVNGVPVSEEQIQLIVDAALAGLSLSADDELLDLCCGNGALTDRLLQHCTAGLGVDFSEYLINVANTHFAISPSRQYMLQDVASFCQQYSATMRFTKAICYGSFSYLEADAAMVMLTALHDRFTSIKRVFIGNCPDRDKLFVFFADKNYTDGIEYRADSAIGIWRTEEEFCVLAGQCGWHAEFSRMPTNYYAAHYRYDVVLTRL
ncbi:methyltransferase domain-containing protein [Shewanella baltica]|uniref:methyltransferase domain-containing protein n=1 Tax=Shewanella baltica TaxID=62322 RepID=UPI003D791B60